MRISCVRVLVSGAHIPRKGTFGRGDALATMLMAFCSAANAPQHRPESKSVGRATPVADTFAAATVRQAEAISSADSQKAGDVQSTNTATSAVHFIRQLQTLTDSFIAMLMVS